MFKVWEKNSIKGTNLLVASFQEEKSFGIQLLQDQNVTRLKVLEQIAHTLDKAINLDQESPKEVGDGSQKTTKPSVLEQFGVNLMEAAKNEELDTLVGREEELERIQEILLRRRKNNPLIVGDAGVGKTALVEGFATKVFEKSSHERFHNITVYSLDIASVLAGAKFRG